MNPEFMAFNCRESCGACGFKSAARASVPQANKDDKEQYSYIEGFGKIEDGNYQKFSCGKYKELTGFEGKLRKKLDTEKIRGGGCSSIVISDRFVVTAAHCVPNELKSGETRQISIRDGTEFHESLEVRRLWRDNRFDPNSKEKYFDIAILELERRVIYDYERYGDSPACLGEENDLDQQIGLVQGFGITEDGTAPDNVLEANVTIISNSKCTSEMDKMSKLYKDESDNALPNGLSDKLLCTQGIWNKKKSVFTGPCDGDDGGPLFINSRVDYNGDIVDRTLVAINSGSLGKCGKDNFPAWWTRIASYVDWLKCIQVKAAETEYNKDVGDALDLTHKQIEEACEGKLPEHQPV
jgi:secreted trypsin-like serine protease